MKSVSYFFSLLSAALLLSGCNNEVDPTYAPDPTDPNPGGIENVVIYPDETYQTMESFAASDCWAPNYVGEYWSSSEKEEIAKLLFSQNISNGQPEGIGLSGWRFNLGAGTAQQGSASDIEDPARRAESFMDPATGDLDWTKQAGQQFFLDKALSYGCNQFVMFSNSPPVRYTLNGKGYSANGAFANLKDDNYDDFADYIAEVLKYFRDTKGVDFDYVSPVNEPQYNWDGNNQEGSGWQNSEIKRLATELDNSLTTNELSTKVMLGEAGAWNYLYETDGDADRKNVIDNLFGAESPSYVGDLTSVVKTISGHSYWTDGNWADLVGVRTQVAQKAAASGLKVYQTEWSMLGDGYDASEFVGFDQATYLDIALYMSKVINCDLVYANASSWSFWTSMDLERWDHKNRFLLISLTPAGGAYGDITGSGTHSATKTLWVLGNYSLFVRPNYKRVELELRNSSKDIFGSAYISPDGDKIVAVYTNLSTNSYDVKAKLNDANVTEIKTYTTSASQDLEEKVISDPSNPILINSKSVVTVVYGLE